MLTLCLPPQQSSLPPEIYCDLLETAADKCAEYSLLELWKFKEDKIRSLTQQGGNSIEKKICGLSFGLKNGLRFHLGASVYDVCKIFGILDPPLSAFGTDLQY